MDSLTSPRRWPSIPCKDCWLSAPNAAPSECILLRINHSRLGVSFGWFAFINLVFCVGAHVYASAVYRGSNNNARDCVLFVEGKRGAKGEGVGVFSLVEGCDDVFP